MVQIDSGKKVERIWKFAYAPILYSAAINMDAYIAVSSKPIPDARKTSEISTFVEVLQPGFSAGSRE